MAGEKKTKDPEPIPVSNEPPLRGQQVEPGERRGNRTDLNDRPAPDRPAPEKSGKTFKKG